MSQSRTPSQSSGGSTELPVHFLTIVLNGEPFIRYHLDRFMALPFRWHWHLVEGVASLTHDTSWSLANGGSIPDELHIDGLSCDGTTEYLDELARLHPEHVTVYRKPRGEFWDGKLEMVAAPIASLNEECLLWQIDADELWTKEQICLMRQLFLDSAEKTAAFFYCNFFVGENLLITTRGTYGNNPHSEWLRCWRFVSGSRWLSHEPPRLCRQKGSDAWEDLATINHFSHAETEAYGLCFQHFAYVTYEQLRFKEVYYGYQGAVERWEALQSKLSYPVLLKDFFPWVKDGTVVNTAASQQVMPLAQRDAGGHWRFPVAVGANPLPIFSSIQIVMRKTRFRLANLLIRTRNMWKIAKALLLEAYGKYTKE